MIHIGIQTKNIIPEYGVANGMSLIKHCGFDRIDFNLDVFLQNHEIYSGKLNNFFDKSEDELYRFFAQYKTEMDKNHILASQMHAPYPVWVNGHEEQNRYMQEKVIPRCFDIASQLNIPWMVIHPFKLQYVAGKAVEYKANIDFFSSLIPLIRESGVKVCLENLYEVNSGHIVEGVCSEAKEAVRYIDELNSIAGEELFGFCLDVGHLQLAKLDPVDYVLEIGNRLKLVHIHETDGRADSHQIPFSYGQDNKRLIEGLKQIGFNKTLSFETHPCLKGILPGMEESALKLVHSIGEYYKEQIEKDCKTSHIRLGVVGTGRIANRFAKEIANTEEIKICCVYHPKLNKAMDYANIYGIRDYTDDYNKLLDMVDAVYIATPHATHYDYAYKALNNKKHVLCEKPMCMKYDNVIELYQLARNKEVVLMEAIKTMYAPGFLALMKDVKSGIIGKIQDVEATFTRLTPTNVREYTDTLAGGSFTEFGSYTLLPILACMGTDYKQVTFRSLKECNGVDYYTKVLFEYADGYAMSKTGLAVKSEGGLVISGSKGYILASSPWWLTKNYEIRFEDSNRVIKRKRPYINGGLIYEIEAFVKAINKDRTSIEENEKISIAIAKIIEEFLKTRKNSEKKVHKANIWAHRGCSRVYPENTLVAFTKAAQLDGIYGIELDVQLTQDKEIVVIHDETLDRTTNAMGYVKDYTLEQIKTMKIVYGKESLEIPTLNEVLEAMAPYCYKKGLKLNIELKTGKIEYPDIEEMTYKLVKKYGLEEYVIYSSFNPESIRRIKDIDNSCKTGILCNEYREGYEYLQYTKADAIHPCISGLHGIENNDMNIRAWNSEELLYGSDRSSKDMGLRVYESLGVTDIFTNNPEMYL